MQEGKMSCWGSHGHDSMQVWSTQAQILPVQSATSDSVEDQTARSTVWLRGREGSSNGDICDLTPETQSSTCRTVSADTQGAISRDRRAREGTDRCVIRPVVTTANRDLDLPWMPIMFFVKQKQSSHCCNTGLW